MISTIKDLVNIAFFIVTGVLAFLSYLNAKKTLFSPIKTEVFKLQIKEFEIILDELRGYDEIKIMEKFDEERIIYLNSCEIIINFFKIELGMNILIPGFDANEYRGAIVFADEVEKVDLIRSEKRENNKPKREEWENNSCKIISFTKKFDKNFENIMKLSNTPVLPENISKIIKDIAETERRNLSIMMDVLSEFSKKLPDLIKDKNDIQIIDFKGLYNIYNEKRIRVSPHVDAVKNEIKNYLKVEKIIH